jgi:hypothetical protein
MRNVLGWVELVFLALVCCGEATAAGDPVCDLSHAKDPCFSKN